jgi:hypothetical protein
VPDENAHAPNEFIYLGNFFNGIRTSLHFFNELPGYMKGASKKSKTPGSKSKSKKR